jgi:aspartyl-tRNA(Asn)/glutamyl-tRNA(Gln) amidotransferase subunit A
VPAEDATAVARLRAAGGIPLAKTNLPEMSYWTETDNLVAGLTRNPYDPERTPGGSSGGESAAIAAGLSPLGLGSDVAISVRGPAHDTGIASIKPTHRRVPYTGHFPDALRRWWHVGPMARSVRDLRLALSILEGPDGLDPYAVVLPAGKPAVLTRVGWTTDAFGPLDPDVAAAVESAAVALADLGFDVEQVDLPWLAAQDHTRTSATLFTAEILPYLRDITAGREADLHPVIARTLKAPDISLADYLAAEHAVEQLRAAFARWFRTHDVLICPVVPIPAPPHG